MQSDNLPVRILITGGTFDKQYDEIKGKLTFSTTHLPEILQFVRCKVPMELEIIELIDSLDMKDRNRERVLAACLRANEERIIITHGTDTMKETAGVIGRAGLNKTVVLTGAMVPYSVSRSDALFNLGSAFTAVGLLPRGVYICMNGMVFTWDNVRKNREGGFFEPLSRDP